MRAAGITQPIVFAGSSIALAGTTTLTNTPYVMVANSNGNSTTFGASGVSGAVAGNNSLVLSNNPVPAGQRSVPERRDDLIAKEPLLAHDDIHGKDAAALCLSDGVGGCHLFVSIE